MSSFGRVDAESNVFVTEGGEERKVGQYLLGGPDEALAFFESKFREFQSKVLLLEQRASSGKTPARILQKSVNSLAKELSELKAVGDYSAVRARLQKVGEQLAPLIQAEEESQLSARGDLLEKKQLVALQAEEIAKKKNPNWKQSSAEMDKLFAEWQSLQKNPVKVPKSESDPIWKRFSIARKTFEAGRRAYFSELDKKQKVDRKARLQLVIEAEKLDVANPKSVDSYRALLNQWKSLGKVSKVDEPLWSKLKAVGDQVFASKKQREAAEENEFKSNLEAKQQILTEAEAIDFQNLSEARSQFKALQSRWSAIGKVPKSQISKIQGRWERARKQLSEAEAAEWRRSDPATIDRSNSLTSQLENAISDLERRISKAAPKDLPELEAQLEIRKSWLTAAKSAVAG